MRTTTPSSLSKPPPEPVHHQGRTPLQCLLLTQSGHGGGPAWVRRTAQFSVQKCDSLLIPDLVLGAGEAMRRREFIRFSSSTVVAWPLAARAQRSAVPVIGFLRSTTAAGSEHLAA